VTARYLLDTNVLSEPLRPAPDPKVLERLRRHQDELATAAIVWHELWFGCRRLPVSDKREAIENYLNRVIGPSLPILPYDDRAAEWHAVERARLTQAGKTPTFADGQIAAISATQELILVTFNRADYDDFQGLKVEDWRR
jgi:tRNA(fMet)-specific endonuclease VapC